MPELGAGGSVLSDPPVLTLCLCQDSQAAAAMLPIAWLTARRRCTQVAFMQLDPLALGLVVLLGALLCYGTSESSYVNNLVTSLNLVVICYILAAGFPRAHASYLADFAPYGARGVFRASSVVFFSYVGCAVGSLGFRV